MKVKHNKKRNTAFVYEALIREATSAIIKNDSERKDKIVGLIKKYFNTKSILRRDLDCYRSLYENQNLQKEICEKILREAKIQRISLDTTDLFKRQTALIGDINKQLSAGLFNTFVPNYKTLATIDQMFSHRTSPKDRIILEGQIVRRMSGALESLSIMEPIDNITYRTFVKKFNTKYEGTLLAEQKELLSHYIASFADNGLQLKMYLNTEIGRLKAQLVEASAASDIKSDTEMLEKTEQVVKLLESFTQSGITTQVLMTVLRTQALVEEIYNVDND